MCDRTDADPRVLLRWQPKSSPALPGIRRAVFSLDAYRSRDVEDCFSHLPGQKSEESDSVDVDLEPPQGLVLRAVSEGLWSQLPGLFRCIVCHRPCRW